MKQTLRNALNKLGFDIVRSKNSNDNLAKHLKNVLVSKDIKCIIDVGANSGQYGLFLREIGYSGYIVSFEPVSSVFRKLKEKCDRDDKWLCYDYALGDKNEEKTINVYDSTVFSSFLKANEYSRSIWESLEDFTPEIVKVRKLDDIYNDVIGILGSPNYMLKVDTQGYDKFVFDGAVVSLENISVLQFELSLIPVYDGMPEAYEILKEFHNNHFYISGMYPINRDQSLAVIEYDCVLVKGYFN